MRASAGERHEESAARRILVYAGPYGARAVVTRPDSQIAESKLDALAFAESDMQNLLNSTDICRAAG
ncbi:MAG: hypothetical protein HY749_22275 [Gammaproteobacteria bacterium]|nr:hypothetical protein [Gammaproteobacteria bacterium]